MSVPAVTCAPRRGAAVSADKNDVAPGCFGAGRHSRRVGIARGQAAPGRKRTLGPRGHQHFASRCTQDDEPFWLSVMQFFVANP